MITFNATATKWVETNVSDPIKSGSECRVNEVLSSGSYVFDWASKYDQIFFPYTSSAAIWFCKDSGYISFMGDFNDISTEERTKITTYLEKNPQNNIRSLLSKLKLIEKIYSFRDISPEVNNRNKRVFAYLYEQKEKFDVADSFRKSALSEIYEFLKTDLTKYKRLEYLYVAANYERQLGNISNSDLRLKALINEIEKIQDEELKSFGKYLLKLSNETTLITHGGKLQPEEQKENIPATFNEIEVQISKFSLECRKDLQTINMNLKPMFTSHIQRTVAEKSIGELISIRKEFINTGNISQQTFDSFTFYEGLDTAFKSKIDKWKTNSTQQCKNEVNTFTDKVLLDFHQHMVRVVNDIASDLGSIKNKFEAQKSSERRASIDSFLIDNSIYYLYCYVRDYDVYEHLVCPEKSLPYKDTFKKVKVSILKSPLKVPDETEIQKLHKGLASIGI